MAGTAAIALVGADLVAGRVARRRAASLIGAAWRTASVPEVRFGGPFLIQHVAGRFREIRLRLPAFTAGGVGFGGLDARLTNVRALAEATAGAGRGIVVRELAATVSIPLAGLDERLPPGFTFRRHGQELRIHGWVLAVPVTGIVELAADRRRILVNPRIAGIPSLLGFLVDLPALPPEVAISSIYLADNVLAVSLTGHDVRFERPATGKVR